MKIFILGATFLTAISTMASPTVERYFADRSDWPKDRGAMGMQKNNIHFQVNWSLDTDPSADNHGAFPVELIFNVPPADTDRSFTIHFSTSCKDKSGQETSSSSSDTEKTLPKGEKRLYDLQIFDWVLTRTNTHSKNPSTCKSQARLTSTGPNKIDQTFPVDFNWAEAALNN